MIIPSDINDIQPRATQVWCTLIVFTQAGGKWFMPPIIVHQAKE